MTITFTDNCGTQLSPADLAQAELFVYGPQEPLLTVTNVDLLNVPYAPFAAYANLHGSADGGPSNLVVNADGSVTYTLSPITIVDAGPTNTGEVPGTYIASILATSPGPATNAANAIDQSFALASFQVGTATVETQVPGAAPSSNCLACHGNHQPGGKVYMAHVFPAPPRSNTGSYALDSLPIGSCKSCHNNKGYSPNTIMRKVHGAHRGMHQLDPGGAHPEYNEGADSSLTEYLNVGFPVMPLSNNAPNQTVTMEAAMEKNCTACHVDNRWQTNFSRAACGTCHDNVFFAGAPLPDGGVDPTGENVVPPTNYGQPIEQDPANPNYGNNFACAGDSDCNSQFPSGKTASPSLATCDTTTTSPTFGNCLLKNHPIPSGPDPDAVCATCHAAVTGAFAPVDTVHAINQWNPPVTLDGYTFKNVTLTGQDAGVGFFLPGDQPVLSFQFFQSDGGPVTDLFTNTVTPWRGTFTIAGPTSNPQRLYGSATGLLTMTSGTTTYNAGTQTWTFTPPPLPANALAPILSGLTAGVAPPGLYTAWFYWQRTPVPTISGDEDSLAAEVVIPFETTATALPAKGRQVVTEGGCASCHGQDSATAFPHLVAHGGPRKDAENCNTCHSQFAQDLGAGSSGSACTTSCDCGGFNPSAGCASTTGGPGTWETCQTGTCVTTVDPTPGVEIDYQKLVHNIHFARARAGYAEMNDLGAPWQNPPIPPLTLTYLGHSNTMETFANVLAPMDVRSCSNCHADSNASCSASSPCAFGQSCVSGSCVNTAWQDAPTARACMTCHDSADDAAHAALNSYLPPGSPPGTQPIESCSVCHGASAAFSVETVHNITTLFPAHLAYNRCPGGISAGGLCLALPPSP